MWLSDAGAAAGVLVTSDRQWQLTMANEATHAARSNCSFAAVRLQLLSPLIASASVDVFSRQLTFGWRQKVPWLCGSVFIVW